MRTTLTFFVISTINLSFLLVQAMTGGGPDGSTEVFLSYMYKQAYTNSSYGYGMAIGWSFSYSHLHYLRLSAVLLKGKCWSIKEVQKRWKHKKNGDRNSIFRSKNDGNTKGMTAEKAYQGPKIIKSKKNDDRNSVSLFYLRSTDYISNLYYYSCCMGFLSLSEAKLGILWKPVVHAKKLLFSKLY